MIKHWYIIMTQSPQLTLQFTVCVVHSMSFVKCRTKNPVCSACSSPQARNDWTQWGRRVRSWDGLNTRPLAPLVKVVKAKETFLNTIKSAAAEVAASYSEELAKITHGGGCTKWCIFNGDKTAFCWKKTPSRTFRAREEKSTLQNFKGQADFLIRG